MFLIIFTFPFVPQLPFHQVKAKASTIGLNIGEKAPDFELKTLDGKNFRLSDLRGKKILLNFWASWCGPCQEEMPELQKTYEKLHTQGVEIIAVNLTTDGETIQSVRAFAKSFNLTIPIPLDINGEVQKKYQIYGIPTSFFIDKNGTIRSKYFGPMTEPYIINELNKF